MDKPKISFKTERLFICSIEESDKEMYMDLRVETSPPLKGIRGVSEIN